VQRSDRRREKHGGKDRVRQSLNTLVLALAFWKMGLLEQRDCEQAEPCWWQAGTGPRALVP